MKMKILEDFLPEVESELLALESQSGGEVWVAAVEDGDLSLWLNTLFQLGRPAFILDFSPASNSVRLTHHTTTRVEHSHWSRSIYTL